uniref:PEX-1N domain-containing protein n=1 Tax=Caenorhabditis tropicalis TaxID=1561998 RepID=A0A1I7TLI2_9PELO
MNHNYPAFVSFHSLSNCFGYAKLLTAINGSNDLSSTKEVILEKMDCKTYCSYIEVAPRTDDDYSVIAQSQASIETEFLNQTCLVSQNMIIPHFLSPGVYVQFRIIKIVPETIHPVILNSETELHVQTVMAESQIDGKAFMAHNVSNVVNNLSTHGFLSNYVIKLENIPMVIRVLPKHIVEKWLKSEALKLDKNTVYVAGKVKTRTRPDHGEKFQFLYLHRTKTTNLSKDALNDSLAHMFDSLQLVNRQHCVDGSGSLEPYANIKVVGVPQNRICMLKYCEVIMETETLMWVEEYDMKSLLIKSLRDQVQGNPILLSVEGKELDVLLDDKVIRVRVFPSIKGLLKRWSEKTCFLLELTTKMIFKSISDPKQKTTTEPRRRRRKNDESENTAVSKPEDSETFGFSLTEQFVQIGYVYSKQLK